MDLMSIGDVAQLPLHMEALQAGKTILVERPIRKKDGAFVIGDVSAKLLEDGRLLASIRDVTHRKQLEDELREAHKVEAVGRFAGGIVDDFATLLGSVSRHAEALEGRLGGDGDVAEIRKAATSGRSLATQLLAVGSKPAPKPEVIDLNTALVEMRGMLEAVLGERIKLVLRRGGDVDPVLADPAQIENVVVDLALHARAEMRGGGTLTIETGSIEFAAGGGTRHTSEGRHTMLVISDTGSGRDGPNRAISAEPHDGAEHLGLALAAVYGLVNQGGGSIGIESEPGVGTTVRIYLPSAVAAGELGTSLGSAQTA
jgi:two-component system cell cycle sensor histidine kinase/response regulator CckA